MAAAANSVAAASTANGEAMWRNGNIGVAYRHQRHGVWRNQSIYQQA